MCVTTSASLKALEFESGAQHLNRLREDGEALANGDQGWVGGSVFFFGRVGWRI